MRAGVLLSCSVIALAFVFASCKRSTSAPYEAGMAPIEPVPGAPCGSANERLCSREGTLLLVCDGDAGLFKTIRRCGGPGACSEDGGTVICDDRIAAVGDACESGTPTFACTLSADAILKCLGQRYAFYEQCKAPKVCAIHGDQIECGAP